MNSASSAFSAVAGATCTVEWTTREQPEFSADRSMSFAPAATEQEQQFLPMGGGGGQLVTALGETRTMIPVYRHAGQGTVKPDFPRQALHATRLAFLHPSGGERMEFHSPLPADMDLLLRGLE